MMNKNILIKEQQLDRLFSIIDTLAWELKAEQMQIPYDCNGCTNKDNLRKQGAIACDCLLSEQLIYE